MLAVSAVRAGHIPDGYALVDATWVMPGREAPLDAFLAGTRHSIDTDTIKLMEPSERAAGSAVAFGAAGLDGQSPVAIYDRAGLFSAPWIWWLLRSNGCDAVLVEGWSTTQDKPDFAEATDFHPSQDPARLNATKADILGALKTGAQILDARPASRFTGEAPEPRPDCRSGHIPGSLNIPFGTLKADRHFQDRERLEEVFRRKGVDLAKPIITSCGSGVTASGLAFALTRCGAKDVRVYQGSWAEWGMDADCPVETGP
ncbi:MAG: rhodanese-like domain-containing protein [Litorimonas sp.]